MTEPMDATEQALRLLDRPGDDALVQTLIESDPGYTERVTGLPPGASDGVSLLMTTPPDTAPEAKQVWALEAPDGSLLAVVDIVRGYPQPDRAFIGLLQVHGHRQKRGLGRAVHEAALSVIRQWPEITTTRLAVLDTNAEVATPFWEKLGYRPTGEVKPYRYANLETTVRLYERPLERPQESTRSGSAKPVGGVAVPTGVAPTLLAAPTATPDPVASPTPVADAVPVADPAPVVGSSRAATPAMVAAPALDAAPVTVATTLPHPIQDPAAAVPMPTGGATGRGFEIREAVPADVAGIGPFFRAIVADGETYAYPEELTDEQILGLWFEAAPGRTVVAVDTQVAVDPQTGVAPIVILGTAKFGSNRPGRGDHIATASFMVSPAARGRGVGRALGEYVVGAAREQGYAGMQFNAVVETNTAAVSLWRSLGFEIIGTVPGAFRSRTRGPVGLHVMFLDFATAGAPPAHRAE